ncbi:MAG: hypothetical protein AB8G23_06875 [Myxococcota bacterium]
MNLFRRLIPLLLVFTVVSIFSGGVVRAESLPADAAWTLASDQEEAGEPVRVFVEKEKRPGNPAFRIETEFAVEPQVAAATLMNEMIGAREMPKGQTRTVLSRAGREVVVQTVIELPLMFSDREVAVRIEHSDDSETGIHRVDFAAANELLPPADKGVVRLDGTDGYWEFRPAGPGRTEATYMTRAMVGGSIPAALGDRLLKAQAVDSVSDLRNRLSGKMLPRVASPPAP